MGKLDDNDTWTIGELIADAARNSKAGRRVEGMVNDYLGRRTDPTSDEYREVVEAMESLTGGRTPAPTRLSWSERRKMDKILRNGKPGKGNQGRRRGRP